MTTKAQLTLRVNHVFFFNGVEGIGSRQTDEEILSCQEALFMANIPTTVHAITSVCSFYNEYYKMLNEIQNQTIYPILQMDFHGCEKRGIKLSSGEYMSWDLLNKLFVDLNIKCDGNLVLVLPICFSTYFYEHIKFSTLPFNTLICARGKLKYSSFENSLPLIYQEMAKGIHPFSSSSKTLDDSFEVHYCEIIAANLIKLVVNKHYSGNKRNRTEMLVSLHKETSPKSKISDLRKAAKKFDPWFVVAERVNQCLLMGRTDTSRLASMAKSIDGYV